MCAHVSPRACAREASAQVADKDGASGGGRHRRSSKSIGCACEIFCRAVAPCHPLLCEQTCCAGNGFSVAEGTCGVRRRAKGGAVGRDQWYPVIQTAPRTANKRSEELYRCGVVGLYCLNEMRALYGSYLSFSSFPNSAGRRKAV